MKSAHPYKKDFYAWALNNATLLKKGKWSEVDMQHVAEEIESMGKSERRELLSRLAVLIAHLLKWQFQPTHRGKSWRLTIKEQRLELDALLKESPSLKSELDTQLNHAYKRALLSVEKETDLERKRLPKQCPFLLKQILSARFFPE